MEKYSPSVTIGPMERESMKNPIKAISEFSKNFFVPIRHSKENAFCFSMYFLKIYKKTQ